MSEKLDNTEDESFIILGTSPGTSLDIKCNGIDTTENGLHSLNKSQIEDAMKELSPEASMALRASFKLGDCPSSASMMVASNIITDDRSTEELQRRFGELLDENIVLKETLKQNNDSMKEQFLLIASCQEDMLKTHTMHKEKFEETKELIERLRLENKKLKQDMSALSVSTPSTNGDTSEPKSGPDSLKSGPLSAVEFVTSPDDDTINKLTAQLELVEKQRRQVIMENEKLTWQKESLEHIVDATTKERDDLKEKLKTAEYEVSTITSNSESRVSNLQSAYDELQDRYQALRSSSEANERETRTKQLEEKIAYFQNELKNAQLKILELENIKLDYSKYKSGVADMMRQYKDNILELNNKLKEATTTVFQPIRFSISPDADMSPDTASSLSAKVKLYDLTLKHLADLLNKVSHGLSDSLAETLGVVLSLQETRVGSAGADPLKPGLDTLKQMLEKQQCDALTNIGQVRGILSIFEGIFKDYKEVENKLFTLRDMKPGSNVEALTSALVARGQELQEMELELNQLKSEKEDTQFLRAQLDVYKCDFEAERESREKLVGERDKIYTELRRTTAQMAELRQQLDELKRGKMSTMFNKVGPKKWTLPGSESTPSPMVSSTSGLNNTNQMYTCPKCLKFSCDQYKNMEDHFDYCLDDF